MLGMWLSERQLNMFIHHGSAAYPCEKQQSTDDSALDVRQDFMFIDEASTERRKLGLWQREYNIDRIVNQMTLTIFIQVPNPDPRADDPLRYPKRRTTMGINRYNSATRIDSTISECQFTDTSGRVCHRLMASVRVGKRFI